MNLTISSVRTVVLSAKWTDEFADDQVPAYLKHPSANWRSFARTGQFAALVVVEADDGTVGVGEAYGLPDPRLPAHVVEHHLAPRLLGVDAMATGLIYRRLLELAAGGGLTRSTIIHAIAGVDIALWDLKARHLGLPLSELLGGDPSVSHRCYASPVPFLDTPEETALYAQRFVDAGFTAVKLKVGRGARIDGLHLRAMREAVGDTIDILVDCNAGYDLAEASQFLAHAERSNVYWLEEPFDSANVRQLVELRRRTRLRIASGEHEFTLTGARDLISSGAIDVFMPNVTRTGLTAALGLAALAEANGVSVAPHGVGSVVGAATSLHYMSAIGNSSIYELNQLPNPLRDGLGRSLAIEDGRLVAGRERGHGAALDHDALRRYEMAATGG